MMHTAKFFLYDILACIVKKQVPEVYIDFRYFKCNNTFKENSIKINMDNSYKEIYKLKPKDFIPIVGVIGHHKRCIEGMFKNNLVCNEDYTSQCTGRDILLMMYNMAIVVGAVYGATGLVNLLSK